MISALLNIKIICACGETYILNGLDITSSRHFDVPAQIRAIARRSGWDFQSHGPSNDELVKDICPECARQGYTLSRHDITKLLARETKPKSLACSSITWRDLISESQVVPDPNISSIWGIPIIFDESVPTGRFREVTQRASN